uniref:Putative secreted protein n=1 Tax=Anopheles marajoara TaxID=58244 RepID=A0A2M4CEN7_9DIPT
MRVVSAVVASWLVVVLLSSEGITRLSPILLTIEQPPPVGTVPDCTTIEVSSSRGSSWESSEQSSSCSRL